jgi:formate hydrogenlyase subunit 4
MIGVHLSLIAFFQGVLLLAVAPGLLGFLRLVKARAQGRRRGLATLWQPYRDLLRLASQRPVRSRRGTTLMAAAPLSVWSLYATLAFAVPVFGEPPLLQIDLIALVYLLALARFVPALAGLDSGAPFGALGGTRSMFLSIPTELALVLIGAALALHLNTLSVYGLIAAQRATGWSSFAQIDVCLVGLALFFTISLEAGRVPIDNPATHLELTMSQKAAALDYAGTDLALIEWGESIKLGVLLTLFASLFVAPILLPREADIMQSFYRALYDAWSMAALIPILWLLARTEAAAPKVRLRRTRDRAVLAAGLSLSAILYRLIVGGGT